MKIICLIVIFLSLYYPTNLNYQISFYEYGYNALVLSLYFDNSQTWLIGINFLDSLSKLSLYIVR